SLELLKGRQDQILATLDDGTPGIIASRFGKGETILIGSFLGLANHPIADQSNNHFLKNLLDWAGIVRPVNTSHDGQPDNPIEVRLQENRDGQLLFILNHGEQREQLHVRLKVKKDGMLDLHEIITNQKLQLKSKNSVLEFDSSIAGKEVQVWRIGL
ncbi:MAG: hypothetical protein ONB32_14180, partial [candidate division KSB1 bacterium]|nr:hypothetical protein [candidate division KSB1 bacterium]